MTNQTSATAGTARSGFLRDRESAGGTRVTNIELFFDLVFVFAVTQLSHLLLHDLSIIGAIHAALLFVAVWWAWIYTSWVTNWLDPERWAVRVGLLALMFVGLVLSTSLPQAFESKGLAFAGAYVAIQVGRSFFMLWALGDASPANTRNFQRITIWLCGTGVLWIAGAFTDDVLRLLIWIVALGIETVGPAVGFVVPGLGRSTTQDWDVAGGHLAERCSLFIIIALGEALLMTGATVADLALTQTNLAAFVSAFIGSVAMWWIYFDTGAEHVGRAIEASDDPGRMARLLYTYFHLVIVAGVIVAAVGDELLLTHPDRQPDLTYLIASLGGPTLFVLGNALFKGFAKGFAPLSHLVGLGLLAGLAVTAIVIGDFSLLAIEGCATAILCLVAGWEAWSIRRGRHR